MKYGYFDNKNREYVITRPDLPTSWTNYLGVEKMCGVVNHTAGGYLFYKTPEYHRITRFRGNAIPMDRPGHYVYIRDDEDGDYHSISWQPVGKDFAPSDSDRAEAAAQGKAVYECRHGMSYSRYSCSYKGIDSSQTLFIPIGDAVELWDVKIRNNSDRERRLSVYSYCEFSYHHIDMDNRNFQMSLYAAGSSYKDGVIEHDLFYEEFGYQFFTSNFEPDGYDCLRDVFIGTYNTETNPQAVALGKCSSSSELGGNHCGSLQKKLTLKPGEEVRLVFMLGEGNREEGLKIRRKYSDPAAVDSAFAALRSYWDEKCSKLHINTPNEGMNTLINIWTLYQSEVNVMFSRFASFIEVGGRTGLGYRDTAQDAMTVPHSNPAKCRSRLVELLRGLTSEGYGLHLFEPEWFEEKKDKKPFKSPTILPEVDPKRLKPSLEDTCSDDALWLVSSIVEYIKETGEKSFADEVITYSDGGEGTTYEHMKKILDFSAEQVGDTGICKGLRADWNDCLNLGGGQSAMVSYLHYWALKNFIELAKDLGREEDVKHYEQIADHVKHVTEEQLWDGEWYLRGFTKNGRKIGTNADEEGKIHLESNAWAVLSGAASYDRAIKAMDSIDKYLYTPYGIMLNAPSYTKPDPDIGFVTRVYPGLKENGAIFSHPNPWAWAAECVLGRGNRAMKFYEALSPYNQNDMIETRKAEPYSYCQFISGKDHSAFGCAHHPFMTGSGGWSYFSATRYMLGIRPDFDKLVIDPCIPSDWKGFEAERVWRGARYIIKVENPDGVEKGVKKIFLDDREVDTIPSFAEGSEHRVRVVMGK